ncbi:hypothetical protein ABPG73_021871 [Tetrahymena malaccensis]
MKNTKVEIFYLNILYLLISYHFEAASSKELLIQEQFQSPLISDGQYGWSLSKITTCKQNNILEYGQVYGVFSTLNDQNFKTVSNLPPHWSVLVKLDLMLYGCINFKLGDMVQISIDSNPSDKYTKYQGEGSLICSNSQILGIPCQDKIFPYQKNVTHTDSSVIIKIDSQFSENNDKGYAFKYVSIFVDTCYFACQSCSGPSPSQCTKCINNASVKDGVCTCNDQLFAHQLECVSVCPDGFIGNDTTKTCEQSKCLNCQNCVNKQCTLCNNSYKLMNGECFLGCPNYSSQNGTSCVDKSTDFNYGRYILKGLYSSDFGDSEIQGQGLFLFNNGGSTFSSCQGVRYLGGWNIAGYSSYIIFQYQISKPHWSVRIGFKYIMIDKWQSYEYIQVILNQTQIISNLTKDSASLQSGNICGSSFPEAIGIYDKKISHNDSNFYMFINNTIGNHNLNETSFGIREMYILVYYCQDGCLECNQTGCTKCSQGTFLYQNNCQKKCPTDLGYWENNLTSTCDVCEGNCLTCSGKGKYLVFLIFERKYIGLFLQRLHALNVKVEHICIIKHAQALVQTDIFQIKIHKYVNNAIRLAILADNQMMKMNALLAQINYIQMALNAQINALIKHMQKQINAKVAIQIALNVVEKCKINAQDVLGAIFYTKENAQANVQKVHLHKKCEYLDKNIQGINQNFNLSKGKIFIWFISINRQLFFIL